MNHTCKPCSLEERKFPQRPSSNTQPESACGGFGSGDNCSFSCLNEHEVFCYKYEGRNTTIFHMWWLFVNLLDFLEKFPPLEFSEIARFLTKSMSELSFKPNTFLEYYAGYMDEYDNFISDSCNQIDFFDREIKKKEVVARHFYLKLMQTWKNDKPHQLKDWIAYMRPLVDDPQRLKHSFVYTQSNREKYAKWSYLCVCTR